MFITAWGSNIILNSGTNIYNLIINKYLYILRNGFPTRLGNLNQTNNSVTILNQIFGSDHLLIKTH